MAGSAPSHDPMTSLRGAARAAAALTGVILLTLGSFLTPQMAEGQVPLDRGVVGTGLDLRGLDGLKRVLLIGAHPDDEDTALLTALARGMGAETAYLSVTRGDGGQNLIGPELGEGLGAIRTGELLAARELDGGIQFFTRAIDFGYSKTADETIDRWDRDEVLRDVALVIRRFRPHVIISVWQGIASDGHGHHQASGQLARDGFAAAADPERFPELARAGYPAWETSRLFLLNRRSDEVDVEVATGSYDPLLGRSHHQLAMDSRSQHRSQDMGAGQPFGSRSSRLLLDAIHADGTLVQIRDVGDAPGSGAAPEGPLTGVFAGVDTTLVGPADRLPESDQIVEELTRYRGYLSGARSAIGAGDLVATAQALAEALPPLDRAVLMVGMATAEEARTGTPSPSRSYLAALVQRQRAVESALLKATSVIARVVVEDDLIVPGDTVGVQLEVWNGGPFGIDRTVAALTVPEGWGVISLPQRIGPGESATALAPGEVRRREYRVVVPEDAQLSRLYYRAEPANGAMYRWPEDRPDLWGLPTSPVPIRGEVTIGFTAEGVAGADGSTERPLPLIAPVVSETLNGSYLGVDKAQGEFRKPPLIVPAISVTSEPSALVWPAAPVRNAPGQDAPGQGTPGQSAAATAEPLAKEITVRLDGWATAGAAGTLALEVPEGWTVEPAQVDFDFSEAGQQQTALFTVTPAGAEVGRHTFRAVATTSRIGGAERTVAYDEGFTLLDYPHIERMAYFDPAATEVSVVPVQVDDVRVGYIFGSGDDGLLALRQMGVEAREVSAADLRNGVLDDLDVLMLGIRVYETQPEIAQLNDRILAFAEAGGTVVSQYNKYEYPRGDFAPYPVEIARPHDRTTDETSPVEFIDPNSPVIDGPNQLTLTDFEGWVQERGLYFLSEWDPAFQPQLRFQDPNEDWSEGSLVVAPYGDGLYVYTGISFFRQFPAGVPGAYRLFANLVSLDRATWDARMNQGNE